MALAHKDDPPSEESAVIIDREQILTASRALLAHMKTSNKKKKQSTPKKDLFDDGEGTVSLSETPIWLTLTTKRHISDTQKLKPCKIQLPHSLNTDPTSSICLITADPQRAYKNLVASEEFPEELRRRIGRVIDYKHLTAKYKQYEAQRQLYAEHDVFLGDDRIINRLPKALGKTFYKTTTKRPIPVVLASKKKVEGKKIPKKERGGMVNAGTPKQIAAEVEKAIGAALVALTPSTNTSIKVGYAGWAPEKLAANIAKVAEQLVDKHVPQKWKNVKSIYIKGPQTTALPIWMTDELWLDNGDVVEESAIETANVGKKRKSIDSEEPVEAALSKKKAKRAKPSPTSDDAVLSKQITATKERLAQKKAKAKAALGL